MCHVPTHFPIITKKSTNFQIFEFYYLHYSSRLWHWKLCPLCKQANLVSNVYFLLSLFWIFWTKPCNYGVIIVLAMTLINHSTNFFVHFSTFLSGGNFSFLIFNQDFFCFCAFTTNAISYFGVKFVAIFL